MGDLGGLSNHHIDVFEVVETLHESDWGTLYKVKPQGLDRTYALKLAKAGSAEDRLLTEKKVLNKLGKHPNITEIYFSGHHNGQPYIVEELAETSLRNLLDTYNSGQHPSGSNVRLSFDGALYIIKQVIAATGFAHSKGITHRDLKPANILLTCEGPGSWPQTLHSVSICDFGLAVEEADEGIESSLEDAGSAAGTVQYLSPEQKSGAKVDHRTDLYTIGLIFYEMLTERKPTINLLKPTEVKSDLPVWVDDFILKCLRPDPENRFQSAEEMLAAIEVSTRQPVEIPPTRSQRFRTALQGRFNKTIQFGGKVLKHTLLSPIYIIFLPFILGFHVINYFEKQRMTEFGFILAGMMICGYYLGAVPQAAEWNFKRIMAENPPAGTILIFGYSEETGRGFTFVDARKLPKIEKVFVSTPEIIQGDFVPQYTMNNEGKVFYYTTPNGLIKIDLTKDKSSRDYRHVVVKSEVFNYFTDLAFVDGQLLAKLKDETWVITTEGRMHQTTDITIPPSGVQPVSNGDYELDDDGDEVEVQFKNYMLGNFNLGHSQHHIWLPQTMCMFK